MKNENNEYTIVLHLTTNRDVIEALQNKNIEGVKFTSVSDPNKEQVNRFGFEVALTVVTLVVGTTHVIKLCLEIQKLLRERKRQKEKTGISGPNVQRFIIIHSNLNEESIKQMVEYLIKDEN